jgi:hypothetical protein
MSSQNNQPKNTQDKLPGYAAAAGFAIGYYAGLLAVLLFIASVAFGIWLAK